MKESVEKKFAAPFGSGSYQLNYREWGDASNPDVLFCAHGFSRNCHDYDAFASRLSNQYRIICPDFPGRGKSDWLPVEAYAYPTYVGSSLALLRHLGISKVDWLGTSMGGIVGMFLAATPSSPIQKLVLNDVGPFFSREVMLSIAQYTGNDERFKDLSEAEAYYRLHYSAWIDLPREEWQRIALYSTEQLPDGSLRHAYDPNISAPAKANLDSLKDADIWPVFEAIQCPILVVHGETSPVLTADVVEQMKKRGKSVQAIDIHGVGHAPALRLPSEIAPVTSWLLQK
jgi:pimeloyl-ACP methyl ester carboxylesterase